MQSNVAIGMCYVGLCNILCKAKLCPNFDSTFCKTSKVKYNNTTQIPLVHLVSWPSDYYPGGYRPLNG